MVLSWLNGWAGSLLALVILLPAAAIIQLTNLIGSPTSTIGEGLHVAQAFNLERTSHLLYPASWAELSAGWWQLAAFANFTDAFQHATSAIAAGREAMVAAHVLACLALWLLARRIGLTRLGATGAVVFYAISPLAIEYHRLVLLDNLAVPWLLIAFLFASVRFAKGLAYPIAIASFAAAVATKPTFLVLLPVLGWLIWRGLTWTQDRTPRLISAIVLSVLGLAYLAAVWRYGEALPGIEQTNIWSNLSTSLYGNVEELGNAQRLIGLDPILPAFGAVGVIAGLRLRWLRPFSVGVLIEVAFWFAPGAHPETYVVAVIPLVALLVAGVIDAAIRAGAKQGQPFLQRPIAIVAVLLLVGNAGLAAAFWPKSIVSIYSGHQERPRYAATSWIASNVRPKDKLIVDDAMWVDLVVAGINEKRLVTFAKARDWKSYQYLVAVPQMSSPLLKSATSNSQPHANFGPAAQRIEVRRILPQGKVVAEQEQDKDAQNRARAGLELTKNIRLHLDGDAREALSKARVDPRLLSVLALLSGAHELVVYQFPAEPGEEGTNVLRRSALIAAVDGLPVVNAEGADAKGARAVISELEVQLPKYRPASMEVRVVNGYNVLEIRYTPPSPTAMPK